MGKPVADQPFLQFTEAEGNERIDIALAGDRLIENEAQDTDDGSCDESPEIEDGGQQKEHYPHEL